MHRVVRHGEVIAGLGAIRPLRASSRSSTRTPASCAPCPTGLARYARSDTRPRAPAGAAPTGPLRGSERRLSRPLRPSPYPLRHPAQETEHVFMRSFVEDSSHATGNHRYAEPVASHKNEFCLLRPPGARPPFRRYACPPRWARTPQGVQPVGRAGNGSRSSHVASPSRTTLNSLPKTLRGGLRYAPP